MKVCPYLYLSTLLFSQFLAIANANAEEKSSMPTQPLGQQELQIMYQAYLQDRNRWLQDIFAEPPEAAKQFDFLLGTWNTKQVILDLEGKVISESTGRWRGQSEAGGRMIVDRYTAFLPGGKTLEGSITLRTYSKDTKHWEMVYLSPMQANLISKFVAQAVDGEIHGQAYGQDLSGNETWANIRFFDITKNSFEWEQHFSWDKGKTWYKTMTISAERQSSLNN